MPAMSIVRNVALFGRPIAAPGDGIDLFDRVFAGLERAQRLDNAEQRDVIRDEVGRVLGDDDALAEIAIDEGGHAREHRGVGVARSESPRPGAGSAAG